jgi:hypothetical protein
MKKQTMLLSRGFDSSSRLEHGGLGLVSGMNEAEASGQH